jgi:hypothetical protein
MMTTYLKSNRKTQSRTGKVARLPHDVREELNQRLRDNVPGPKICKWVNQLPAAKAVCAEFAKRSGKEESPINESQVSEWRRGGSQDWLREQQVLHDTREMARWSVKLAKDGGGELSEGAAVLLSGQLLKLLQGMTESKWMGNGAEHGIYAASADAVQDVEEVPEVPAVIPVKRTEGRAPEGEGERVESTARVLGTLVKCLSGIRKGDQNKVRLAQVDRKLAQRDRMIALEREKYDNEQAEINAKKKAEQKKKRGSGLSDHGKIDWVRGRMFGHEHIIREKEKALKELQRDLAILKKKFNVSESSSENGELVAKSGQEAPGVQVPTVQRNSKDQVPTAASANFERTRVNASACDQLQEKNGAGGGQNPVFSTKTHEKAETQGVKKFDPKAMRLESEQIDKELAMLQAELNARGGSANGGTKEPAPDSSTHSPAQSISSRRRREGAKECDPETMLRDLEQLKKELAALKVEMQMTKNSSGELEDMGIKN